ncbi:MAG: polysaccharide biosynthesis/export family protein [Verrucomicrobiales bacterium]
MIIQSTTGVRGRRLVALMLLVSVSMCSCGLFKKNGRPGNEPRGPKAVSLGDYRLSPGNVIYIDIFEAGRSTMESDLVVDPTGNLDVPEIGETSVDGMTPLDAAKKIEFLARRSGQNHLSGPRVHVKALDRRAVVHLTGNVRQPGPVTYYDGLTVTDAIKAAGGAAENANPGSVELTSGGRKSVVTTPDVRELEEGDVVNVPRRL